MTDYSAPTIAGDFTGLQERRQTLAFLQENLVGGHVYAGAVPEETQLPHDSAQRLLPYVVLRFGMPIAKGGDRAIAVGEKEQVHRLPLALAVFAGVSTWAEDATAEAMRLLLDWQPTTTSGSYTAAGGYGHTRPSVENRPTRYEEGLFLELDINLGGS